MEFHLLLGRKASTITAAEILSFTQAIAVIVGVVISVLTYASARRKEAEVRRIEAAKEAETRRIEAAKPFLELHQKLYLEALRAAAVLADSSSHSDEEIKAARKRFRELYIAELSMVEPPEVETKMVDLAKLVDPELTQFTPAQNATYDLAHALRNSFTTSYGLTSDADIRDGKEA